MISKGLTSWALIGEGTSSAEQRRTALQGNWWTEVGLIGKEAQPHQGGQTADGATHILRGSAHADQLQATIQNAQLAGNIRVAGLYNLGRLSVDAYSYLASMSPVSL